MRKFLKILVLSWAALLSMSGQWVDERVSYRIRGSKQAAEDKLLSVDQ